MRADCPTAPRPVLHNHGLTETLVHLFGERSGDEV
jgi:hypothetical protein